MAVLVLAPVPAPAGPRERAPDVGTSYQVPFRLTNTNHYLVRVRINGKGPFNFLVDTGAPALYVATSTARKIGLKPAEGEFWTSVRRLDFEGGAYLTDLKARIEDPFQLVGMNALGLPGASIDGILGFTILARFRLELDPTRDRMTWTRLDYEPADPPAPPRADGPDPARDHGKGEKPRPRRGAPAELQAMNLLGPLAKLLALATGGKQPEDQLLDRGVLGIELDPRSVDGASAVRVAAVLAGSAADKAGVRPGDALIRVLDRPVRSLQEARDAVAEVRPGDRVSLIIRRGAGDGTEEIPLTACATEGL